MASAFNIAELNGSASNNVQNFLVIRKPCAVRLKTMREMDLKQWFSKWVELPLGGEFEG